MTLSSICPRHRRRRRGSQSLALSLAAAFLLGSIANAQGANGTESALPADAAAAADASALAEFCTASTGRELVVALATPACRVVTLTGVITVYDADFAGLDREAPGARVDGDGGFARATPVVLRSADGVGVGAAGRNGTRGDATAAASSSSSASFSSSSSPLGEAPRAALEAATRLTLHVDVPKGVAVELSGLSLAGISVKAPPPAASARAAAAAAASAAMGGSAARPAEAGGGAMFSIFHIHAGGEVTLAGCDLRAKRAMCSSSSASSTSSSGSGDGAATPSASPASSPSPSSPSSSSVGGRVDTALLLAAAPNATFRRGDAGSVVIERATMDPMALFGNVRRPRAPAAAAAAAAAAPPQPGSRRSPQRKLLSPSPSSAPPSSTSSYSSAARLVVTDTVLWCPETGFVRAGRPSGPPSEGRGVSVASRVWTPLELSSALGSAGSRTVLCEDDLVLPRAGHGRPAALVQDRDVVFRAAADAVAGGGGGGTGDGGGSGGGGDGGNGGLLSPRRRPVRLSCLHEPGARDCVFPVVAAGPGGSISFEGLSIEAPDPGCAVEPATRCSYRGRELPHSLRGSLTPAGAAGLGSGGWLVFSDVDLSYDFCTAEFERAAEAVAAAAAASASGAAEADGVTLVRSPGGGNGGKAVNGSAAPPPLLSFSCARCDFDCSVPGSVERGEPPATFSLRNTTISCSRPLPASLRKRAGTGVRVSKDGKVGGGVAAAAAAEGVLASSSSSSSPASPPPPSSNASTRLSTSALAGTLAVGGAAVAAAALGAALGAKTIARRAAAAEAAAEAAEAAAAAGSDGGSASGDGGRESERFRASPSSSSPPVCAPGR